MSNFRSGIVYLYRENRHFIEKTFFSNESKTKNQHQIFKWKLNLDMTNNVCIRNSPEVSRFIFYSADKKNIISYHQHQPVLIKPVVYIDFYENFNLNNDLILIRYVPGITKIFHDNMHYDHTKFWIAIIFLRKVTGVSCTLLISLSESLSLNVNFSAWMNANKAFVLEKIRKIILRWLNWLFLISDKRVQNKNERFGWKHSKSLIETFFYDIFYRHFYFSCDDNCQN